MKKKRMLIIAALALVMIFAMTVCAYGAGYQKYDSPKTGTVTAGLNVRVGATTDSALMGSLAKGSKFSVYGEIQKEDGIWYGLFYNGKTGYVSGQYVTIGKDAGYVIYTPQKYGKITCKQLIVRKNASKSSSKLGKFKKGKKVALLGYKKDNTGKKWYRVKYNGKYGYISSRYTKQVAASEAASSASATSNSSAKGDAIAAYALKWVGKTKYKYGGSSLKGGADCSGFVKAVYAHFGYKLPHSDSGIRKKGRGVGRSNAKPGDVICTNGHVGIYIGNGKMVHARQPGERVRVDKIGSGSRCAYNGKKILSVRRIAK